MFELTTGAVAQTMTSIEIAELTGKEKKHIHRDIKEQLLLGLYGIDGPKMDLIDIKRFIRVVIVLASIHLFGWGLFI